MAGLRAGILLSAGLAVWVFGTGPLAPYRRALFDRSAPQLVLVLGGDVDRERVGARLARELQLPLLVRAMATHAPPFILPDYPSTAGQLNGLEAAGSAVRCVHIPSGSQRDQPPSSSVAQPGLETRHHAPLASLSQFVHPC